MIGNFFTIKKFHANIKNKKDEGLRKEIDFIYEKEKMADTVYPAVNWMCAIGWLYSSLC